MKFPPRPASKTGPKPRWCRPCARKHKAKLFRERRQALRAWNGLRPHEIVPDAKLRLDCRRRNPRALHLLFVKVCVECGASFRAGHRAVRCLRCRVVHQRRLNHGRYLRAKARAVSGCSSNGCRATSSGRRTG